MENHQTSVAERKRVFIAKFQKFQFLFFFVSRPQGSDFMALGKIRIQKTENEKNRRQAKIEITAFLPMIFRGTLGWSRDL